MSLLTVILVIFFAKYTLQQINCGKDKYTSYVELAIEQRMYNAIRSVCGGVLISSMFVLTTKQCLEPYEKETIFALFENNTSQIRVDFIIMNNKNEVRGVCLLQLARSVETTKYTEPICLPTIHKSGTLLVNNEEESAEWLLINHQIKIVNKKKIKIQSSNNCKECFDSASDLLCSSYSKRFNSVGGFLIKKMEQSNGNRYQLFGLFIDEKPDCDDKNMQAIVDISHYLVWIQNNIREVRVTTRGFERRHEKPKVKTLSPFNKNPKKNRKGIT